MSKQRQTNMHLDELWQIYARNGEAIPGAGWESALGNPEKNDSDKIVGIAIVFLYRKREDGGLDLLWQKRSDKIDRYPGYYDISAGGHINLGESVVDAAIRECHEEIGAEITADDLEYGLMQPFNVNRFAWIYFVDWTGREDDFHFNDQEVSEVKWVPYEETSEFVANYAKPPLAKDKVAFILIDDWLRMHGYIQD